MIRIAIVEDETEQSARLRAMLERYASEIGVVFSVCVFQDGEDFITCGQPFDIAFLDIQMKAMDGMSTARRIRETNDSMVIVFVTNLAEYAIEGYAVSALTYLLKPVGYETLRKTAERALDAVLKQQPEKSLTVKTVGGTVRVRPADLLYVEISNRRLMLHTAKGVFYCNETMQNMEEQLDPDCFFRCHVAYLVNLNHVARVDRDGALVGENRVLVSKYRRKEFLNALTRYVGGRI